MAALEHADVVRTLGKDGRVLPLARLFRDGAPLLARAQVTRSLSPVEDSARVGVALAKVLAERDADTDGEEEEYTPAGAGAGAGGATAVGPPAAGTRLCGCTRDLHALRALPQRRRWTPCPPRRRRRRSLSWPACCCQTPTFSMCRCVPARAAARRRRLRLVPRDSHDPCAALDAGVRGGGAQPARREARCPNSSC
jgi:hypothetical protein